MKTNYKYMVVVLLATLFASCNEWLSEPTPNETTLEEYFTSEVAAVNNINADYVPLMWEWNANTFYNEFLFGDIMSDDALKGGNGIPDCSYFYSLENFKGNADNDAVLQYYRTNYIGIARCNLSLEEIPMMDESLFTTEGMQKRLIAEAKFLRAMYYFRLVRIFQDVPLVTEVIDETAKWKQPVAPVEEVYALILKDLNDAEKDLWEKGDARFSSASDIGRATKGAAQAMLMKVNLYLKNYEEAENWGKLIVDGKKYSLHADYGFNFTLEGENQAESVFEVQYMSDGQSDWGEGIGFTRGSYAQIMTRSRGKYWNKTGYGFNKPTQNLYDEYEEGDARRDLTIWAPPASYTPAYEEIYLGNVYCSRKYAIILEETEEKGTYFDIGHETRGPLNRIDIRYADVLLMYAEACLGNGNTATAEWALEEVRARARAISADPSTNLPKWPNYTIKVLGVEKTPTLEEAIRHERRVELAMEGHRWYDLVRWGIAKETMDYYATTETPEAQREMAPFIEGVHEYFPLPTKEVELMN